VPAAVVICNWFEVDRGKALGVAMAGEPIGATMMTLAAGYMIATHGWRAAYLLLSVLILVTVIPSAAVIIRTRPSRDRSMTNVNVPHSSHGMDVAEALRNRTFALIVVAEFCCAIAIYAVYFHLAVYLTGIGYTTYAGSGRPASNWDFRRSLVCPVCTLNGADRCGRRSRNRTGSSRNSLPNRIRAFVWFGLYRP